MKIRTVQFLSLLLGASASAQAEDWTFGAGLFYRDMHFKKPGIDYERDGWTGVASLSRHLSPKWDIGASLAYDASQSEDSIASSQSDSDSNSVNAYVSYSPFLGTYVSGSLGYGTTGYDGAWAGFSQVTYDTRSRSLNSSVGVTQFVPLSPAVMALLRARYTYYDSKTDSFRDSAGTSHAESNASLGVVSVGGTVTWLRETCSPYASLDWNRGNREIVSRNNDRSYYRYGLGASCTLSKENSVAMSYGGSAKFDDVRDDSIGLQFSHRF